MPLLKVIPKVKTQKAEVYEIEGRYVAVIKTPPTIDADQLDNIREVLARTLDMDVIVTNADIEVEIVEVQPRTRHERIGRDTDDF